MTHYLHTNVLRLGFSIQYPALSYSVLRNVHLAPTLTLATDAIRLEKHVLTSAVPTKTRLNFPVTDEIFPSTSRNVNSAPRCVYMCVCVLWITTRYRQIQSVTKGSGSFSGVSRKAVNDPMTKLISRRFFKACSLTEAIASCVSKRIWKKRLSRFSIDCTRRVKKSKYLVLLK